MRSPWNGGSSALRCCRCSLPSSSSTLRAPSSGLRIVVALARVQHVRVAGEDLLDVVGVTEHHPRRALLDVEGEDVAVAVAHAARVRAGAREPADRLREVGARRTGGKAHSGSGFAFGLGLAWLRLGLAAPRRPALPRSRRAGRRTGRGRSPSADHARSSGGRCDVRHVRARGRRARGRARRRSSRPRRSRRPSRWAAEPFLRVLEQGLRRLTGECVHALHHLLVAVAAAGHVDRVDVQERDAARAAASRPRRRRPPSRPR